MKKSLVLMGLLSLFLTACGGKEQTSSSQQSSSSGEEFSATLPILQEKEDTSNEKLDVLANAEINVVNPNPPADETQKAHKIHAANNGVA